MAENSKIIHYDKTTAKDPLFVSDKGPGPGDSEWDCYEINKIAAKAAQFIKDSARGKEPFFLCYFSAVLSPPPPVALDSKQIRGTTPSLHTDMNRVIDWRLKNCGSPQSKREYENTLIMLLPITAASDSEAANRDTFLTAATLMEPRTIQRRAVTSFPSSLVIPVKSKRAVAVMLINGTDILATMAEICRVTLNEKQAMDSASFIGAQRVGDYQPRGVDATGG